MQRRNTMRVMLNQNKIWVGCIALLFSSSLSAQPAGLKENLKNYFLHQLEKKSDASLAAFSQKKALKWKEAQKYQTLVWKAWQEANAQMDEEKLIPLRSLCPKNKGMWHLPASLEPSALLLGNQVETSHYCRDTAELSQWFPG